MIDAADLKPQERIALYQKTRLGVIFFIVSFTLSFVTVLVSLVPCIGSLLGIVSFGFLIAGFVLLIIGSKAFLPTHRMFVLISLVGLVILFVISIFIAVIGVFAIGIGSFMPGKNLTGQDIVDSLNSMKTLAIVTMIPSILSMAIYSLPFFGISKTWGKGLLVAFIIAIPIAAGVSFVMKDQAISDAIGSIDKDEKYEVNEFSDITTDLTADMYPGSVVAELPYLLLIIAVVGSLLHMTDLRDEAQESLPPVDTTFKEVPDEPENPHLVDPAPPVDLPLEEAIIVNDDPDRI